MFIFSKVADFLLKKTLTHVFCKDFANIVGTPILRNTSEWLLPTLLLTFQSQRIVFVNIFSKILMKEFSNIVCIVAFKSRFLIERYYLRYNKSQTIFKRLVVFPCFQRK